jgi:hypothetical protein
MPETAPQHPLDPARPLKAPGSPAGVRLRSVQPRSGPLEVDGHGLFDPIISVGFGRDARDRVQAAGADVTYLETRAPHTGDPRILGEAELALRQVMPANKVNRSVRPRGEVQVYFYSKGWPCLFPQHGPGKKHLRRIQLSAWQGRLIRAAPHLLLGGLIHSDGCRDRNVVNG